MTAILYLLFMAVGSLSLSAFALVKYRSTKTITRYSRTGVYRDSL